MADGCFQDEVNQALKASGWLYMVRSSCYCSL